MTIIQFDEQGFGSDNQRIRWDELLAVGIRTTADGPFLDDVFWQFLLSNEVIELSNSVIDSAALTVMQKQLAGMDSCKIISAMGSTKERIFRIWHVEESKWRWDDNVFNDRFRTLVGRLGGQTSHVDDAFRSLNIAWSEKKRRYHDLEHLADCLRELDNARADPNIADIVELALWYHDVIYEPRARDCEKRSAERLCNDGPLLGLPNNTMRAAANCICATAHCGNKTTNKPWVDLVVDIDLSILGRDVLRFMEYEYAVEEEYAGVLSLKYFLARGRFLASLMALPAIFRTDHFRKRYEGKARANITALLSSRRYQAHRWFGRIYRCFR